MFLTVEKDKKIWGWYPDGL